MQSALSQLGIQPFASVAIVLELAFAASEQMQFAAAEAGLGLPGYLCQIFGSRKAENLALSWRHLCSPCLMK